MPVALNKLGVRGSWYSQLPEHGWVDLQDRPGSAAYHVGGRPIPDAQQGIALPTRSTLGKWFDVVTPEGKTYRLQQTDIGPHSSTGRGVDISAAAAQQMGYTPKTFPTDSRFVVTPAEGGPPIGGPEGGGQGATEQAAAAPAGSWQSVVGNLLSGLGSQQYKPAPRIAAAPAPQFTPIRFTELSALGRR